MTNPFETIDARLSNIESLLLDIKHSPQPQAQTNLSDLLNIKQAAELLGLSTATLYTKVHNRTIPFIKTKGSKTLRFSRKKIMEWLDDGQKETQSEMEQRANDYLVSKK